MKKLHFSIFIAASQEIVWDATIGKDTYKLWAEVFSPGSDFKGSWDEGAKILFIGPNENGKNDGMVSEIAVNRKHEFISIKHLGYLQNDVEDTMSPEVKAWAPAYENYTFKDVDGGTEFVVDIDTNDEFEEYFSETWPKALKALKEVAETGKSSLISVTAWIKAPIEKVWEYYISPEHITQWAFASDDWEAPFAENDVKVGGRFKTTMAAKDPSTSFGGAQDKSSGQANASFDFTGTYTKVKEHELLEYKMDDGRMATVSFAPKENLVQVTVVFDMEHENTRELQRDGWQAILNNFKKHVEGV